MHKLSKLDTFPVPPYFLSPSLHTIITLGNQLLVEKAVEKMNLREKNNKTLHSQNDLIKLMPKNLNITPKTIKFYVFNKCHSITFLI